MADPLPPLPSTPVDPGHQVRRSYVFVLLGVAGFVVNAGVSRVVLTNGVGPVELASVRAAGTALLLLAFFVLTGRLRLLRVRRHEIGWLLLYGLVGVGSLQVSYFAAIERLPIGLALLLEYLAPLLVAMWARLVMREQVRATLWPALALSLLGLALVADVFGSGADLDGLGVLAGLAAAVSFAVYFLVGEHLVRGRDPVSTTFWGFAIAAVAWTAAVPFWPVLGQNMGVDVVLPAAIGAGTVPILVLIGWVVLLGTLFPFALETAALRHIPATIVTVIATLEPIGAALLAWWWFDESLDAWQLLGVLSVVTGIVLGLLSRRPPGAPPPPGKARDAPRRDSPSPAADR